MIFWLYKFIIKNIIHINISVINTNIMPIKLFAKFLLISILFAYIFLYYGFLSKNDLLLFSSMNIIGIFVEF